MVFSHILNLLNCIVNGPDLCVFEPFLPSVYLLLGWLQVLRLEVECRLNWRLKRNSRHIQVTHFVILLIYILVNFFLVVRKLGRLLVWKSLINVEVLYFYGLELVLIVLLLHSRRSRSIDHMYGLGRAPECHLTTRGDWAAFQIIVNLLLISVSLLKHRRNFIVTRRPNRFSFELLLNLFGVHFQLAGVEVRVVVYLVLAQQLKARKRVVVSEWKSLLKGSIWSEMVSLIVVHHYFTNFFKIILGNWLN